MASQVPCRRGAFAREKLEQTVLAQVNSQRLNRTRDRYIHRDTRTYVVEPSERRIIEEID
jgi:hypothetical protein